MSGSLLIISWYPLRLLRVHGEVDVMSYTWNAWCYGTSASRSSSRSRAIMKPGCNKASLYSILFFSSEYSTDFSNAGHLALVLSFRVYTQWLTISLRWSPDFCSSYASLQSIQKSSLSVLISSSDVSSRFKRSLDASPSVYNGRNTLLSTDREASTSLSKSSNVLIIFVERRSTLKVK